VLFAGWTISETWQFFPQKYTNYYFSFIIFFFSTRINWLGFFLFNETTKELTYFIDGKTFVWIYIFLNICLSTKYLKWKINLSMDIVQPAKSTDHVSDILLPRNRPCYNLLHREKYRTCLLTMIRSDSFYPVVCICCLRYE
jgi:hypothetical protein